MTSHLATLAALLVPVSVAAQFPESVHPGDRVRVAVAADRGGSHRMVGAFLGLEGDSIALAVPRRSALDTARIATADITAVDRSIGRHARTLAGAGIGAAFGAGLGGVAGLASGDDPSSETYALTAGGKALVLGVVGALAGGLIGLAVGAATKTDRWEPQPLVRTSWLGGHATGVSLGVRLNF